MRKMKGYSWFGHILYLSDKDINNNKIIDRDKNGRFVNRKNLKCPKCGRKRTKKGHDPCIANLPGVKYACCGHGTRDGYIAFENGITIRGKFKVEKNENFGNTQI